MQGACMSEGSKDASFIPRPALLTYPTPAFDLAQIMIRDMDGAIQVWSEGIARLYGFAADEALGRISHELLQTEFPYPLSEIDAELRRAGE